MEPCVKELDYNPPSLKLLSACRVRQAISCMKENYESDLVEKLTAGDFDGLENPNVPISLNDMCKYNGVPLQMQSEPGERRAMRSIG